MGKSEAFLPYEVSDYHWSGLDPDMQKRFLGLAQEFYDLTGEKLKMRSGYRSTEHQAKLYAADPNSGYVAKPGGSTHETGFAIDLDKSQVSQMPEGMIEKHFNRPLMGQTASGIEEPWHLESPSARENPVFNTRDSVLAKIGEALGPSSANAAESGKGMFTDLLPKQESQKGGMFADLLPRSGLSGHLLSGAERGLGHSLGKVMAEAAQAVGPVHGFDVSQETGTEIIKNRTPEYNLSNSGEFEKTAFALGEAGGALPEYLWRGAPAGVVGGVGGGFATKLLSRAAGSAIPFAQATALEPDVTGRQVGAAAGAGALLPTLRPLPWWARGAGGFGIGYGQTGVGNPDADFYDKVRGGGIMALLSMIHGRQARPTAEAPPPPPTPVVKTQSGRTFDDILAAKRAANQAIIDTEMPRPAEPWRANQRTINREMPQTLSERNQIVIDREMPTPREVTERLVPRDVGLGVTVKPGGSTAVPMEASEPGPLVPREPGNFRPGGVVALDGKGNPVVIRGFESDPVVDKTPAAETPVVETPVVVKPTGTVLSKQEVFKMAQKAKDFNAFNKAIGNGILPEGVNLQEFYDQIKGAKQGKVSAAAHETDLTPTSPINDISYSSFINKLADSVVHLNEKGDAIKVTSDWATVASELQQASTRFDELTFAHHFNPMNIMSRIVERIKETSSANDITAARKARSIMQGYGDNVWKPFRNSQVASDPLTQKPVVGGRSGSPDPHPDNPAIVNSWIDPETKATYQHHIVPDPATPNGFRVIEQQIVKGRVKSQRAVASGIESDLPKVLDSISDTSWVQGAKHGIGYRALEQKSAGIKKMYSGGPDTSEAMKAIWKVLKPFADDYKSRLTGEGGGLTGEGGGLTDFLKDAKDMSGYTQFARLPVWVGKQYPSFGRVTSVSDSRIEQFNQLKNNWVREAKDFVFGDLPPERVKLLDQRLTEGDAIGMQRTGMPTAELREAIAAHRERVRADGEDIYSAYMSARNTYDMIWDDTEQLFKRLGLPDNEISNMRQEMGYQPEYVPHTWEKGKYYVVAKDQETGDVIHRTVVNRRTEGDRVFAAYEAQYGKGNVETGKNVQLPDEVFSALRPESAVRVLQTAMDRAKLEMSPADLSQLKSEIVDTFKLRGAMQRFTKRSGVGGYRVEGHRAIAMEYMSGMAGFMSKLEAAPKYLEALNGVELRKTPNLYEYGRKYVRDVMANASEFDRTLGTWRALMFHQFLGASVRAAAVNLTQNWVAFAPWMAKEGMTTPEIKVGVAIKDVLANWKSFRGLLRGEEPNFGGNVNPIEGKAMSQIFRSGALNDYNTQEMAGQLYGKGWGILNKVADASREVFGTSESLNRVASALSAFRFYYGRLAKQGVGPEAAFETATKQAGEAVISTHYLMGTFNLPEVARGSKIGSMFRASGYQFKGFTHNYLEMLAHLFRENPTSALRSMGTMAALAGPLAIPIVNECAHIYKWATRTDPVEDAFQNKEQNPLYTALKYGLPGFLGADLSSSIGAQVVRPDTPASMAANTVFGPLGSLALESAPQAANLYKRGAGVRSLEPIAPIAVKNVLKAYRESTEGVTTTRGQAVMNEATGEPAKLTTGEGIRQSFGFKPTSASTKSAQVENLLRRKQGRQDAQDEWASQYVRALRAEDDATMERIMGEVDKYNEWAIDRNEPPIKLIELVKDRMKLRVTPKSWRPFMNERQ